MKFLLALLALITGVSAGDAVRAAVPVAAERGVAAAPLVQVVVATRFATVLLHRPVAGLPALADLTDLSRPDGAFPAAATVQRSDRARE